jgi:hypothetical protein
MRGRRVTALLLILGLAGPRLWADEPRQAAAPAPGMRVRFETSTERRRAGTVVEMDGDTLAVRLGDTSTVVRVPVAQVRSLEVAVGRRSYAADGALIGAIPGAVFGAFVGVYAGCYEDSDCGGASFSLAALGALLLGSLTGLVGAAIGALFKTDKWQKVSVSTPRAQLQLGPTDTGGVAVGLKVSF